MTHHTRPNPKMHVQVFKCLRQPKKRCNINKRKMDEADYHDEASYTSESEDVQVSPPKKRRRTISASSNTTKLVSWNDPSTRECVAPKIKKLEGKLDKNSQTKQYCTDLSQHFNLAKQEGGHGYREMGEANQPIRTFWEVRIHNDAFITYQQEQKKERRECGDRIAELEMEIASLKEQQAKHKKAKDKLFDVSQSNRLVVQARRIHSNAVKELKIAREKADAWLEQGAYPDERKTCPSTGAVGEPHTSRDSWNYWIGTYTRFPADP